MLYSSSAASSSCFVSKWRMTGMTSGVAIFAKLKYWRSSVVFSLLACAIDISLVLILLQMHHLPVNYLLQSRFLDHKRYTKIQQQVLQHPHPHYSFLESSS